MKIAVIAGAALAGAVLGAPSASAYTAQALCPQWSQRGPIIRAACFDGRGGYNIVPATIDLRTCAPGADVGNYFGVLVCINPQRPNYGYQPPPPVYGGGWPRDEWRHHPRGPNWD